ncbi:hypothetical protein, partial [Flavobacterium muglaense]|uniref:hypothetical protein n=1 Tax=Flavobacterium muglaense TaxID=2764716 RepID=UPI001C9A7BED
SRVISVTRFRCLRGIFSMIAITVSAVVSITIATIAPFFPLAALLVIIVKSSPLDREVSSIDKGLPMFSGKISPYILFRG